MHVRLSGRVSPAANGRGRAPDKVFVERLWRSVKYEEVSLKEYADGWGPSGHWPTASASIAIAGSINRSTVVQRRALTISEVNNANCAALKSRLRRTGREKSTETQSVNKPQQPRKTRQGV